MMCIFDMYIFDMICRYLIYIIYIRSHYKYVCVFVQVFVLIPLLKDKFLSQNILSRLQTTIYSSQPSFPIVPHTPPFFFS